MGDLLSRGQLLYFFFSRANTICSFTRSITISHVIICKELECTKITHSGIHTPCQVIIPVWNTSRVHRQSCELFNLAETGRRRAL